MTQGFVYIASNNAGGIKGTDYVKEAVFSATSLKKIHPKANITLFTNKQYPNLDIFNKIEIVDIKLRSKQDILHMTPYDKTIYIDTDTYINDNVEELFGLFDNFELFASHDYARKRNFPIPEYMAIPTSFGELNGGVFGFKKCENFNKLLELWKHYFHKYHNVTPWDQPSFRIACWESKIRLYIVPCEYNRRGRHAKQKGLDAVKKRDPKFPKNHLNTRIYHAHNLEGKSIEYMDKNSQEI
tara:strand:- start:1821 stop:2543 length:723 start_codon:yes stop_codon:yes gene_type:complete